MEHKILESVLKVLALIVDERNKSYHEIAQYAIDRGFTNITDYKIRSVSNGKFEENKMVKTLDYYIGVVLDYLNITDDEFFDKAYYVLRGKRSSQFNTPEKQAFIEDPEFMKYLNYAYLLYQSDKAK